MTTLKNIIEINSADEFNRVTSSTLPVVVDFWAPWCGPCRNFAPTFEEIAAEFDGKVLFAKVNVDIEENGDICSQFGIRSIPTISAMKNSNEIAKHIGSMGKDDFITFVKNAISTH